MTELFSHSLHHLGLVIQASFAMIFGLAFGNFFTTVYHRRKFNKPVNGILKNGMRKLPA
jgi:hypothetical protein